MASTGNTVAGFARLRGTSRCRWAEGFVSFVRDTRHGVHRAPSAALKRA